MKTQIILLTLVMFMLSACSVNKFIPEGKALYDQSSFNFTKNEDELNNKKQLETDIQNALYVEPNSKFLGLWMARLWIYYKFQDNNDKGIPKYLYENYSEEPIYISDLDTILLGNIVKKQMQDHGYFYSKVNVNQATKKKRASLNYDIVPGKITIIDSIRRPAPNTPLDSLAYYFKSYSLQKGKPYTLNAFQNEREGLAKHIRSKGYYTFQSNDIYYLVDTAQLRKSVSVTMKIKAPENDTIHRQFYIKDVNVFVEDFRAKSDSANIQNYTYTYRNYRIYDPLDYIDKRTIERNLLVEEKSLFNVTDYELTLGRLLNLNVFKYVNIEYKQVNKDSLDVNIYLTPKDNSGIQFTAEANTSDRSFLGANFSASFYNDNALKRAERLSAGLKFGSEFQLAENNLSLSILNLNAQIKYSIPRILAPVKIKKFRTKVPPKTIIKLEEDFQLWLQYFTKNSVNGSFGYEWERRPRQIFSFSPLFVNVNNVFSTTEEFDMIINDRPLLGISFQDNITFGSILSYKYSTLQTKKFGHFFTYRTSVETAGNTTNLISSILTGNQSPEIFGLPVAQYVKLDFEIRYTRGFNDKESLVTRLATGMVGAYGSSDIAPFTKQYFMGGPTTLRGFEARSVGPGNYRGNNATDLVNPIDQAGDIRLLYNAEYRFPIFSVFRGATFIDAGNVWLIEADPTRPEAQFSFSNFYKQIALNTGFGIRMDVDYFALRLDVGIPIYEPSNQDGSKWIWEDGPTSIGTFYTDYMVISGGIGYPF